MFLLLSMLVWVDHLFLWFLNFHERFHHLDSLHIGFVFATSNQVLNFRWPLFDEIAYILIERLLQGISLFFDCIAFKWNLVALYCSNCSMKILRLALTEVSSTSLLLCHKIVWLFVLNLTFFAHAKHWINWLLSFYIAWVWWRVWFKHLDCECIGKLLIIVYFHCKNILKNKY